MDLKKLKTSLSKSTAKEIVSLSASPEELRIIAELVSLLALAGSVGIDYPCKDGKGVKEYQEMSDSLKALADEMESREVKNNGSHSYDGN